MTLFKGIKKIFVTALGDVNLSTDLLDTLGDIRFENGKVYKYVLYSEGTAALDTTIGHVLVYVGSTGYHANTVSRDYADASGQLIGAGVAVAAVTTDARYMWVQIKGPFTMAITLGGTATDGSPLTAVGASSGGMSLVGATAANSPVMAFATDASAKLCTADFPF